jgi:hypothetical protein
MKYILNVIIGIRCILNKIYKTIKNIHNKKNIKIYTNYKLIRILVPSAYEI